MIVGKIESVTQAIEKLIKLTEDTMNIIPTFSLTICENFIDIIGKSNMEMVTEKNMNKIIEQISFNRKILIDMLFFAIDEKINGRITSLPLPPSPVQ